MRRLPNIHLRRDTKVQMGWRHEQATRNRTNRMLKHDAVDEGSRTWAKLKAGRYRVLVLTYKERRGKCGVAHPFLPSAGDSVGKIGRYRAAVSANWDVPSTGLHWSSVQSKTCANRICELPSPWMHFSKPLSRRETTSVTLFLWLMTPFKRHMKVALHTCLVILRQATAVQHSPPAPQLSVDTRV